MIAVDSNLLVYAHRTSVPEHRAAQRALERAAGDQAGWGITQASVTEFWSVVTHTASAGRPSTPAEASAFLRSLLRDGDAHFWLPGPGFGERLLHLAVDLDVRGPRIVDLQIAGAQGSRELDPRPALPVGAGSPGARSPRPTPELRQ